MFTLRAEIDWHAFWSKHMPDKENMRTFHEYGPIRVRQIKHGDEKSIEYFKKMMAQNPTANKWMQDEIDRMINGHYVGYAAFPIPSGKRKNIPTGYSDWDGGGEETTFVQIFDNVLVLGYDTAHANMYGRKASDARDAAYTYYDAMKRKFEHYLKFGYTPEEDEWDT